MKACRPSATSGGRVWLLALLALMSSCESSEEFTPPPRVVVYATGGPSVDLDVVCYGSGQAQTCVDAFDVSGAFDVSDQPVTVGAHYLFHCAAGIPGLNVSWQNETASGSGQATVYPPRDVGLGLCAVDCACNSVPLQEGLNWIVITTTVTGEQPGQLHVPVVYSPAAE